MTRSDTLKIVVGFSAGSLSDRIAQTISGPLAEALGVEVKVELMPGGNGATAARAVANAAPDGRTLFMATLGTHALACHARRDLPYDPVRDFAPVMLLAQAPLMLACNTHIGVAKVADLITRARYYSGALAYGSSAMGGAPHLAAALFEHRAGVRLRHVRYDRTEELYRDLEEGRLAVSFNNLVSMLPRCADGRLVPLAVTSARRSALAADVPTLAESGIADFDVTNWAGLVAPRLTPVADCLRVAAALNEILRTHSSNEAWVRQGFVEHSSREAFGLHIAAEIERWKPVAAQLTPAAEHRH